MKPQSLASTLRQVSANNRARTEAFARRSIVDSPGVRDALAFFANSYSNLDRLDIALTRASDRAEPTSGLFRDIDRARITLQLAEEALAARLDGAALEQSICRLATQPSINCDHVVLTEFAD